MTLRCVWLNMAGSEHSQSWWWMVTKWLITSTGKRKNSTKGMWATSTLQPDGYRGSERSISTDSHVLKKPFIPKMSQKEPTYYISSIWTLQAVAYGHQPREINTVTDTDWLCVTVTKVSSPDCHSQIRTNECFIFPAARERIARGQPGFIF